MPEIEQDFGLAGIPQPNTSSQTINTQSTGAPTIKKDGLNDPSVVQDFKLEIHTPGSKVLLQPPSTDPSYLQYLATIGDRIQELRHVLQEIEVQDHLQSRDLMAAMVTSAFNMSEVHYQMTTHFDLWDSLVTKQNVEINQLNKLINDYNDHEGVEPYKSDLLAAINVYNTAVEANNQIIELLNFQRQNLNIPELKLQEDYPYTDPLTFPLPTITVKNVPQAPSQDDFLQTYYAPLYELFMANITFVMDQHELSEAFIDFLHFNFND